MAKYRQQPKDITQYATETAKRVSRLERTPRAPNTALDSGAMSVTGGNIEIDGGNFTLKASNGAEIVKLGDIGFGNAQPGWRFLRAFDGSTALMLFGTPSARQYLGFFDASGNLLMSDDAASGVGMATPNLPIQSVLSSKLSGNEVTTTSGSFSSFYRLHFIKWQPRVTCWFIVSTPVGVGAQLQLFDPSLGSTVPNSVGNIPANTFAYASITGNPNHSHGFFATIDVQMRVSSGAGTVGASLVYSFGVGS